jgi:hypothetical protein
VDDTTSGTPESYGDDVATERFEADVIWDDADVIRSINVRDTGPDAELTVITDNIKKLSGNAVVKVYKKGDAAKFPVWSYHIWVTDPDQIRTVPMVNGHVFMDRNLGAMTVGNSAVAFGLLYQWGRKDPFPGTVSGSAGYSKLDRFYGLGDAAPTSKTANPDAIKDAIQHPTTFYGAYKNVDWLPVRDNSLWRASGGEKTIYDPCPDGWKVPGYKNDNITIENSPWMEYLDAYYESYNVIREFEEEESRAYRFYRDGKQGYYPAAGIRKEVGQSHYQWRMCVLHTNYAWDSWSRVFLCGEYDLNIRGEPRYQGMSVRCVQE